MLTLLKREINSFLNSLIGYIVISVFLLAIGLFTWVFPGGSNVLDMGYANIDTLFIIAPWVFMFLIPAITMRLFSDEKKTGTIELLLTRPISDLHIILAKYFAGLLLVVFSLLPTLIYFYSIYNLGIPKGNIDTGGMWGSYTGLLFLSGGFVAIGVFSSAITENQIIAFITSTSLCFFCFIGFQFISTLGFIQTSGIENIILTMGINEHYVSMSRGVLDTRDIIYFLSITTLFILLTKIVLESRKRQNIIKLSLGIAIIILINVIGSFKFERFDLTSEKRYSLSDATKKLVEELDDIVYVKVYLEGEFPAGFVRLRNATKEMLDEFRVLAGWRIEYEFINPFEDKGKDTRDIINKLAEQGLQPTNLKTQEGDGVSQKIIFPCAMFTYKERELPLQLLKSRMGADPETMLNNSIQGLEYEFSNTIRKLCTKVKPKIAFIEGHGELRDFEVMDISRSLSEYYQVTRVKIDGRLNALKGFKAIVIAKPDSAFSEKDKFIIDRFIMNGGKVLWLVETVLASMDGLDTANTTFGIPNSINIEDQLFKYGVRINANLIQDIQAGSIPVNTAIAGTQPQWKLLPWLYFPVLMPVSNHPVVNNLNAIKCEFANSIDTVSAAGIKKTILLTTSAYTRLVNAPVRISLQLINELPDEKLFNSPFQPVAVLLEGEFQSVFQNRLPPAIKDSKDIGFIEKSPPNAMIVISDGDIIRNQVQQSSGKIYPLGYDLYTGQEFGNKDFILNVMDYLCDESGLIGVRSKDLKLRLLDRTRVGSERFTWQLLNTAAPIALVIIFGVVLWGVRRRRYA